MADWAPEIAKRDFTVRDGADYDLAGTFRDATTKELYPVPEGSTAFFRVGTDGAGGIGAPGIPPTLILIRRH